MHDPRPDFNSPSQLGCTNAVLVCSGVTRNMQISLFQPLTVDTGTVARVCFLPSGAHTCRTWRSSLGRAPACASRQLEVAGARLRVMAEAVVMVEVGRGMLAEVQRGAVL